MKAAFFTSVGNRVGAVGGRRWAVGVAKVQRYDGVLLCSRCHCALHSPLVNGRAWTSFFLCPAFFIHYSIFCELDLVGVCTTVQQTGIMLGIVDALEILELAKRKSESGWQPGGNPTKSMLKSQWSRAEMR